MEEIEVSLLTKGEDSFFFLESMGEIEVSLSQQYRGERGFPRPKGGWRGWG